jgi:hypothetical protein
MVVRRAGGFRFPRLVATLAALVVAGVLIAVMGQGPSRRVPLRGAILTSATAFGLSGAVGNLAPGVASTLTLTVTNPYSAAISLNSVTVSVPATSVPPTCGLSNLTINNAVFPTTASGGAFALTITAPTSPLPVSIPANSSAPVSLPILMARTASNGCASVTFPFNYSATAAYTATTKTTIASSSNPSLFGNSVTFTATVASSVTPDPGAGTPAGTVSFYLCTNPTTLTTGSAASACTTAKAVGSGVAVNASGQASVSTAGLPPGSEPLFAVFTPTDPTNYSSSSSAILAQTVTFSTPCITAKISKPYTVASGQSICIETTVSGSVTVNSGGALYLLGATVSSTFSSTGATSLELCGSSISGGIAISGTTGFVLIGDKGDDNEANCTANTLKSTLSLTNNLGGFEVGSNQISGATNFSGNTGSGPTWQDSTTPEIEGNTISSSLSCTTNTPTPINDGSPNSVSGPRSGTCTGSF